MASPFSVFRKRQKLWMMVACLVAIVSFVFLTPVMYILGRSPQGKQDLVVVKTTKYGNLRLTDMNMLRQKRQKVKAVLTDLGQAAGREQVDQELRGMLGPDSNDQLIDTWLKVQRAHELGMVVSDETVTRFLESWTKNRINHDDILAVIGRPPAVTETEFCDFLRDELLAKELDGSFEWSVAPYGQQIATPSQRWDWFNRVTRKAVIEAVPLAVANCTSKVEAPSKQVLKDFFEENKDNIAYPASPKPGFRHPQKAAVEYFRADIAQFAAKVTDAEIRKEYEKNKENYDKQFRIAPPEKQAKPEAAKEPLSPKKSPATAPKVEPKTSHSATKPTTPALPKQEQPKNEPKMPATENNEAAPKAGPTTEPKSPSKNGDSKKGSSAVPVSPFSFAAMQAEKPADKPVSPPAATKPAAKSAPPAAAPEKAASKQPKSPAKTQQPPAQQKPVENQAPAAKKAEQPTEQLPVALRTAIRQRIAVGRIVEIFERLRKPIEDYQQDRKKHNLTKLQHDRTKQQVSPPPSTAGLEKLAKQNGLTFSQTGVLPIWDTQATEIGASLISNRFPVWAYIYQAPTFRSAESIDVNMTAAYLFWKSEDAKEYVPSFDDKGVRQEVLDSWKMVQARAIAGKEAKVLADEANRTGKSLKQLLVNRPGLRLVLPPEFTWLTVAQVAATSRQPPQVGLSPVAGVPMAGEDFMAAVFQLGSGQAGVAFNSPQTIAYVVRPSEFNPSYEVRWRLFLADSFGTYASAGTNDAVLVFRGWLEELKKSAGFEWGPGHKIEEAREADHGSAPRSQPIEEED